MVTCRQAQTKITLLIFVFTVIMTACRSEAIGAADRSPTLSTIADSCLDPLVSNALAAARRFLPDSELTARTRSVRPNFMRQHLLQLFDPEHKGGLDAQEFIDWQWAIWLSFSPPNTCRVTKKRFFWYYLGDKGDKDDPTYGWDNPAEVRRAEQMFRTIDRDNKGYLVKEDFRANSLEAFKRGDRNHDGIVTPEELKPRL